MSTIKSSDEHLTLNADGASKDIKFQANGVEKASISSSGAFTSTTIDATKLTGTIPNFTSTGIDDNADVTAMTITSDEKIGIGTASPTRTVDINHASTAPDLRLGCDGNDAPMIIMDSDVSSADDAVAHQVFRWNNTDIALITAYAGADTTNKDDGGLTFKTRTSGSALATRLDLTADGRGLSEFTAKAWVSFNGDSTIVIKDSHNVSSITDNGTGHYSINFANNMANANYVASGMSGIGHFMTNLNAAQSVGNITVYTVDHVGNNNDKPYNYLMVFGA